MKKLLWTSAMALTVVACLTACDDSSSGASNSVPSYKTEAALPDTCEMEVAKAGDTYFACFENEWVEVTDSVTVEKIKEGLDEKELKEQLEELEEKIEEAAAAAAKKPSSSSKKVASSADADDGDVTPESSASEEECTGRRCRTGGSSSSKKSSGGSGNGGSGSGEGGSGSGSSSDSGVGSSDSDEESSSSDKSSSSVKNSSSSVNNSSSSKGNSSSSVNNSSSSKGSSSSSKGNSSSSVSSSSVTASSSSVDMCKGKSWTTSQFCDSRDGQIYKKVTLNGNIWMAENLKYATADGSYCNPNVEDYCDTYGRLYNWTTTMGSAASSCGSETMCDPPKKVQGICPDGWHLPSKKDYEDLYAALGSYGAFENENGFHALKAGWWNEGFEGLNTYSGFWTTTQSNAQIAYRFSSTMAMGTNTKTLGNSVRCIKD